MEERLNQNTRLKYVEKMGNSLADILVCKDPWASMGCGRVKCLPCQTSPGKCMKQGVLVFIHPGHLRAGGGAGRVQVGWGW